MPSRAVRFILVFLISNSAYAQDLEHESGVVMRFPETSRVIDGRAPIARAPAGGSVVVYFSGTLPHSISNDARAERAREELFSAIHALASALELKWPEKWIRVRGVTVARAIVYMANHLPPAPEGDWPKTKQIQTAGRMVKDAFDARLDETPADTLAGEIIRTLLTELLVRAQAENHVLARMPGNDVDVRRTDRILRDVARRLNLPCETELVYVPPQTTR